MIAPALPPFAYATESAEFERRWFEEIPRRLHELQTRVIPERNILKYVHGRAWSFHDTQGKPVPGEFRKQEEAVTFSIELQQNGELEKLTDLADDFARRLAGGMQRRMFETVEEVTKKTGNQFTWKKAAQDAPTVFLKMLQKVEFGVTPDGQPSLPTFMNFPPEFLAELAAHLEANPAYREMVEQLKSQKIAAALARETERKAKFQRPS